MKNATNSLLFKGLIFFFLFSVSLMGFVACQQDDSLNSFKNEKEEILESREFKQYVISYLKFENKMISVQNNNKPIGSVENKPVYFVSKEALEMHNNIISSRSELTAKYPSFNLLSDKEKNDLLESAIVKYDEMAVLLVVNKPSILRLKSQASECSSHSTFDRLVPHVFSSADAAIAACRAYGLTANKESSGVIFADGSAIWFYDPNATIDSCGVATLCDTQLYAINNLYHYHPYNETLSGADSTTWNNSDASSSTIITSSGSYTYYKLN